MSSALIGDSPQRSSSETGHDGDPITEVAALRAELAAVRASEERWRTESTHRRDTEQRLLARLAGGMAHDFNNLLTVIAGYATLLNEDDETPPAARTRVAEILRASDCAKELTQKLLILSRRKPHQPRVIEVDQFLRREALQPLNQLAGTRVEIDARLGARDACVRADTGDLLLVLSNLVLNARDAMPAGGVVTIATAQERLAPHGPESAAYVRISVTDTGGGMDESVQARLFEPFFSTKRLGTGSGLGLAIVKSLVEREGGFVDAKTAPGLGTTMTVWLPVTADPVAATADLNPSVVRGGRESVLVVDDDGAVRELTCAILSQFGYDVTPAPHAHAALALAREGRRFDLVVSDVVMPAMTGDEMVARMRAFTPGFKVLFVSGYAESKDAGTRVENDAATFLAKPFTPAALAMKVRSILD